MKYAFPGQSHNISHFLFFYAEEDTPTYRHGLVTMEEGEGKVEALASDPQEGFLNT